MLAADRGYVVLLRLRGARPLLSWVSLARLQYGVLPLSLLLLVSGRRDSFTDAGAALAVYGLAAGLLGPARARMTDRFGARRALVGLAVVHALALTGLTAASVASFVVLLAFALLAGCTPPPVGPVMRTAWRRMSGDDEELLRRAYSLDAVSEEILYVLGPLVAAAAVAWLGAPSVVLGSAGVLVVAAVGIAACLARPESRLDDSAEGVALRPPPLWRSGRFVAGLAPVAGLGFLLGGLEIAAVAAALTAAGSSAAGVPAAAVSAGSVVGGLIYGHRAWPGSALSQARLLACLAGGLVALAAVVASVFGVFVAVLAIAGLCIAPAIVCSYLIADESAPVANAEATAWVNAAFNSCLALGSASAGILVDSASPREAMLLLACAASVVVLLPGLTRRRPIGQSAHGCHFSLITGSRAALDKISVRTYAAERERWCGTPIMRARRRDRRAGLSVQLEAWIAHADHRSAPDKISVRPQAVKPERESARRSTAPGSTGATSSRGSASRRSCSPTPNSPPPVDWPGD